jgi:hypothetical protein
MDLLAKCAISYVPSLSTDKSLQRENAIGEKNLKPANLPIVLIEPSVDAFSDILGLERHDVAFLTAWLILFEI